MPASTRISAGLKHVQEHSSPVNVVGKVWKLLAYILNMHSYSNAYRIRPGLAGLEVSRVLQYRVQRGVGLPEVRVGLGTIVAAQCRVQHLLQTHRLRVRT